MEYKFLYHYRYLLTPIFIVVTATLALSAELIVVKI